MSAKVDRLAEQLKNDLITIETLNSELPFPKVYSAEVFHPKWVLFKTRLFFLRLLTPLFEIFLRRQTAINHRLMTFGALALSSREDLTCLKKRVRDLELRLEEIGSQVNVSKKRDQDGSLIEN